MNYKTYSISGLISAEEDFNRIFLSEKEEETKTGKNVGGEGLPGNITAYHNKFGDTYLIRNDTYADGVIAYPEKNQPTHRDKNGEIKGKNLYTSEGIFSGQLNEWHDSYLHNH